MFFASVPSEDRIIGLLAAAAERPYNYAHVERTQERLERAPDGFRLDQYGTEVGIGDAVFDRACETLRSFEHYPSSFTRVVRAEGAFAPDLVFGTLATHFGFASLHPCRIIYVIHEESPRRFGFAIGTLPGHIGAGEECFMVSQAEPGGVVRYDVQAISRPDGFVAWLGRPFFSFFQKRFQRETLDEMRRRCAGVGGIE